MESLLEYFQGKKPKATAVGEVASPDVVDPALQQQQKVQQAASPVAPATPMGQLTPQVQEVAKKSADQYEMDFEPEPTIADNISAGMSKIGKFIDENPAFLMGATPVLMGFLAGDPQVGYEMGSKVLFDEAARREKRLEELRKAEAKRLEKSGTDKAQMKTLYNKETGEKVAVNYDPVTRTLTDFNGNPIDMAKYSADMPLRDQLEMKSLDELARWKAKGGNIDYKKGEDERLYAIDKLNVRKPRLVFDPRGLTPLQREAGEKKAQEYNKVVGKDIDGLSDLESSWNNLLTTNQLANKAAVMRFVKDLESRLSDQDRAYYTSEISRAKQVIARMNEEKTGQMNPRLIRDALGLAAESMRKIKKRLADKRKLYKSQLKGSHPNFPKDRLEAVFGELPQYKDGAIMVDPKTLDKYQIDWEDIGEYLDKGYQVLP